MALKVSWFTFAPDQQRRIEGLVPQAGWSLISRDGLRGVLPDAYLAKVDSVIGVSAPTSTAGTCLMFNNLRVDTGAYLIDQDPLGFFLSSSGVSSSGVLVHHGDWDDRSWEASTTLWRDVEDSGIGGFFPAHPPEGRDAGSLTELPKGAKGALGRILDALRARKAVKSSA